MAEDPESFAVGEKELPAELNVIQALSGLSTHGRVHAYTRNRPLALFGCDGAKIARPTAASSQDLKQGYPGEVWGTGRTGFEGCDVPAYH